MRITILNGSPHKNGTTAHLLEKFIGGANDAGHETVCFDTAFMNIHPCMACDHCGCGDNECAFKDDMLKIYPALKEADVIAFASPTYYFGISAQLKTVIDRFYGIDKVLLGNPKKTVLITCAAGSESSVVCINSEYGNMVSWK